MHGDSYPMGHDGASGLLAGPCVKTGRIQKLRLNFLVAEVAARADATRDDPFVPSSTPHKISSARSMTAAAQGEGCNCVGTAEEILEFRL